MKHTRRHFLQTTFATVSELGLMKNIAWPEQGPTSAPSLAHLSEQSPARIGRPAWMRAGIVAASAMESLTFIVRRGGQAANETELWHTERSEESVRKMKDLGVNVVVTNLLKGFGLRAEGEDIEATRQFTAIAHRHDLRVFGYVGNTMMYETFFKEEPEARNWMQRDELGHPVYYPRDQTFRYAACRNTPGYKMFIEKVIRMGIEDLKLDGIHFDQMMWWPEPLSCRETNCQEQFSAFLRSHYSDPHRARLRFGFSEVDEVAPPPFHGFWAPPLNFAKLDNPVMQEWARFRAASLAQRCGEYDEFIHRLNPDAAMIYNPPMDPAKNMGFLYGVDYPQLLKNGDAIWTEEANTPKWTSDGRLISRIRSYKIARSMGQTVFLWQRLGGAYPAEPKLPSSSEAYNEGSLALRLAESIAYNDANLGVIAGADAGGNDEFPPVIHDYVRFFKTHLPDLIQTSEVVDVAILRSFAATQFNPGESNFSTILFEQVLIQSKIPFGVIFDRDLDSLKRYKVLVLANQDALSDQQIEAIRQFVKSGGGLVATERTSLLTEWRLWRGRFGLSDVFGVELPSESATPNRPIRRTFGMGRVVYVPRIEPATRLPEPRIDSTIAPELWMLPNNHQDLTEAVKWASGDTLSASIDAPEWVTSELAEQKSSNTWLLHLLNFRPEQPIENIPVHIRIPEGLRLQKATIGVPGQSGDQAVRYSQAAGIATLTVPRLDVYALVTMRMRG
jgi:hypothetical protein